jgi:hypothetical protein
MVPPIENNDIEFNMGNENIGEDSENEDEGNISNATSSLDNE